MVKDYDEPLDDYEDEDEEEGSLYRIFPRLVVAVAICGFGLLAWYAYHSGTQTASTAEVPLIEADKSPLKTAPENPGGMEIPHQDKKVFEAVSGGAAKSESDRVLPAPEEPVAPTTPPAPVAQQVSPAPIRTDTAAMPSPAPVAAPKAPTATPAPGTAPTTLQPLPTQAVPSAPVATTPVTSLNMLPDAKPAPKAAAKPLKPVVESVPLKPKPKPAAKLAEVPSSGSAKGVRVQLAALKSKDEANATWAAIKRKQGAAVSGMSPHIETADLGAKGTFYRLQLTGFKSEADAKAVCAKLASAKQGCFLVK